MWSAALGIAVELVKSLVDSHNLGSLVQVTITDEGLLQLEAMGHPIESLLDVLMWPPPLV